MVSNIHMKNSKESIETKKFNAKGEAALLKLLYREPASSEGFRKLLLRVLAAK